MPNYDYFCDSCESTTVENFPSSNRPEEIVCACGERAHYRIAMPMIMRASYPDGTRRKGFQDMKEAAKLMKESSISKIDRKKEIASEIRKMGVDIHKK